MRYSPQVTRQSTASVALKSGFAGWWAQEKECRVLTSSDLGRLEELVRVDISGRERNEETEGQEDEVDVPCGSREGPVLHGRVVNGDERKQNEFETRVEW